MSLPDWTFMPELISQIKLPVSHSMCWWKVIHIHSVYGWKWFTSTWWAGYGCKGCWLCPVISSKLLVTQNSLVASAMFGNQWPLTGYLVQVCPPCCHEKCLTHYCYWGYNFFLATRWENISLQLRPAPTLVWGHRCDYQLFVQGGIHWKEATSYTIFNHIYEWIPRGSKTKADTRALLPRQGRWSEGGGGPGVVQDPYRDTDHELNWIEAHMISVSLKKLCLAILPFRRTPEV